MNVYVNRIGGKASFSPSILTYTINVPDDFKLTKILSEQNGEKQKVNDQGQPLYYKYELVQTASESYWNKTVNETIESRTVTKTEQKEVTSNYTDENGVEHTQTVMAEVPVDWLDNDPVLIPNLIQRQVDFSKEPIQFTVDEVVFQKYSDVLEKSGKHYILADEFITEDDLDLAKPKLANTGVKVLQLLPLGEVSSKEITLEKTTKNLVLQQFEADAGVNLEINGVAGVNGVYTFSVATDKVVLRIVNTNSSPASAYAYALCYDEEV